MLTAFASSTRTWIWVISACLALALPAACADQSTERRGGGALPDLTAGSGSGDGGAAGAHGEGRVAWCDAYEVINCVCQQCHQNPTRNGAPMPLMTYEDTQARFPTASSSSFVWERMQIAVSNGLMPETGNPNVEPAVKPLTDEQRDTLLGWLAQGAHDEGGRDCPQTCDWK